MVLAAAAAAWAPARLVGGQQSFRTKVDEKILGSPFEDEWIVGDRPAIGDQGRLDNIVHKEKFFSPHPLSRAVASGQRNQVLDAR